MEVIVVHVRVRRAHHHGGGALDQLLGRVLLGRLGEQAGAEAVGHEEVAHGGLAILEERLDQ